MSPAGAACLVNSVQLSSSTPIVGCELSPYILLRREDGSTVAAAKQRGQAQAQQQNGELPLQHRWYRRVPPGAGEPCWATGRAATLQFVGSPKFNVPQFHAAGADAFRTLWKLYHRRAAQGGDALSPQEAGLIRQTVRRPSRMGDPSAGKTLWVEVGRQRAYAPTQEDVGHRLRFECRAAALAAPAGANNGAGAAPQQHAAFVETDAVLPAPEPLERLRVPVEPMHADGTPAQVNALGRFSVLSFNVLADLYATKEQYSYCAPWALTWAYRRQNLLRELLSHEADILCLQEVQSDHFEDFFQPEMSRRGYSAVYKKKTGEIYTGTGSGYAIDGCATFFRRDRFSLVKKYEVEFNKAALALSEGVPPEKRKAALNRLLKDNVALIAVLEALEPHDAEAAAAGKRQLVCIANTHIHANPELNDVKLWQVHTLLKGLEKIAASADIPMIVAGDLNSVPGSAAHSLLARGRVDAQHPELGTDPLGILRPASKLSHQLPLVSAYSHMALARAGPGVTAAKAEAQRKALDRATSEPPFTNVTHDFVGTLDYIFYTAPSLVPVALLELVRSEQLADGKGGRPGLPNGQCSSDHLPLLAEFATFVNRKN